MKGDEIFRGNDRYRTETVTPSNYVAEYKQMHKLTIEFLSKFRGHGIKIGRVNSIRIVKSYH